MNTTTKQLLLAAAITMLAACGNNETPPSGNPSQDMNTNDMSDDMPADMGEKDTSPDTPCTPNKTTCEATDCGMIDNGCGTALDCGACACTDGVAEARSCGICDLGKPVCDADANSKEIASCEYPTDFPDSITEDLCQNMVFVSADAAPNGTGAIDAPFDTYAKALDFLGTQSGIVIVARGTYNEPLIVKERIHVLGGYRFTNGLVQNDTQIPEFKPPAKMGEPVFGMIAKDIAEPTLVYRVRVTAPDADIEQTSYGAYIVDTQFLTISHSEIYAGRGGDGVDGVDGMKGADGGNSRERLCFGPVSGLTGATLNGQCTDAYGGEGGNGGFKVSGISIPRDGQDGRDTKGGNAGANVGIASQRQGNDGEDGPKITETPTHGENGTPEGIIQNNLWITPKQPTAGNEGKAGSGGGGGGGSGGILDTDPIKGGIAGGAGGAGGCGGKAGTGGTNGGSSFAMFSIRSQFSIIESSVTADSGGLGGNGGQGGSGGEGGEGLPRTNVNCAGETLLWHGGAGGDGADGQDGGNGGAGAGGSSYGAYCLESQITKDEKTTVKAGASANGGRGGEKGPAIDQWRCYR